MISKLLNEAKVSFTANNYCVNAEPIGWPPMA